MRYRVDQLLFSTFVLLEDLLELLVISLEQAVLFLKFL
jgi:hypothetical protein